jgi:hypothetical protein
LAAAPEEPIRSILTAAVPSIAALSLAGVSAADVYQHYSPGSNSRVAPRVVRHCSVRTKPCGTTCIARDELCHVPIGVTVPPHLNPARANANAPP